MERKIGEVFECNGVRLKVVEADECDKCYFAYKRKYGACTRSSISLFLGFVLKRIEKTVNQFNSLKLKTKK